MKKEVEEFRSILKDMGDLYERKNADYGGAIERLYTSLVMFILHVCYSIN